MRFLAALAVIFLIAGCLSEAPEAGTQAPAARNVTQPTPQANESNATGVQNPTAENVSVNATVPGNPAGNETIPGPLPNTTRTNGTENITGIPFGDGNYLLVFEDLSVPDGEACALMSIMYASNLTEITKLDICPGESQNWIDPGGRVFRIRVLKTAAGYSGGAGWAQVEIFG